LSEGVEYPNLKIALPTLFLLQLHHGKPIPPRLALRPPPFVAEAAGAFYLFNPNPFTDLLLPTGFRCGDSGNLGKFPLRLGNTECAFPAKRQSGDL
jgi:hypothetical protein